MAMPSILLLCKILLVISTVNGEYKSKWSQKEWCEAAGKTEFPCADPKTLHKICRYGTACKERKPLCHLVPLTGKQKDIILDAHNKFRNDIALGNDKRMPEGKTAANMLALNWDEELEILTRCHAVDCEEGHDKCRHLPPDGAHAGQNWFMMTANEPLEEYLPFGITSWYEEIKLITKPEWYDAFAPTAEEVHAIGHFTAIIWAETSLVGCVVLLEDKPEINAKHPKYKGDRHLYCDYLPQGNVLNQPMFKTGPGASQCPPDKPPNKKYPGLCGEIRAAPAGAGSIRAVHGVMFGSLLGLFLFCF